MRMKSTVRGDARSIKLMLRNLPAILTGKTAAHTRIREAFIGGFSRRMMELVHRAAIRKSNGGTDELGESWKPLKRSTIRWRRSRRIASKYPRSRQLKMMRLSERLFDSIKPGSFNGTIYIAPEEQVFHFTRGLLTLGSSVPYAERQFSMRSPFPKNINPWLVDAIRYGLRAATKLILEQ